MITYKDMDGMRLSEIRELNTQAKIEMQEVLASHALTDFWRRLYHMTQAYIGGVDESVVLDYLKTEGLTS